MIHFKLDMALPYVTSVYPGIGGVLRARPEYFDVEEIPLYDATGEGEHLFVNVTKVDMATRQVQSDLARLFGLRHSQVGFAGLKDKRARTTQTFSLGVGRRNATFVDEAVRLIEEELDLQVNWARFHRNKLKTGHLLGNRFSIVVSGLACELPVCMGRCKAIAAALAEGGLPNYFGPQRFGRNGGNVRQGLAILAGEVSRSDKWLRKFLVGSVQSYLCNLYLAERLQVGMFDRLLAGDVAKKYATGGMFEVQDVRVEQIRYAAGEISFTAPMFGPKMWRAASESGELEKAILERSGLVIEDFARVRVTGTRRLGRLLIDDLEVLPHVDGVLIRFTLPKGAYATTVLREFMKNESGIAAIEGEVSE